MKRSEQMKFRATPGERAAIQKLAEVAGMTLQDYLITKALGTTSQDTLVPPQSQAVSTIEPFGTKGVCVSYRVGQVVRGMEATKVLAGATKVEDSLALASGYLWVVSKSANGSQKVAEVVGVVPDTLVALLPTGYYLKELYTTYLPRFNELTGLPGWSRIPESDQESYLGSIRRSEDRYQATLKDVEEAIGSLEPEKTPEVTEVAPEVAEVYPTTLGLDDLVARLATTAKDEGGAKTIKATLSKIGAKKVGKWTADRDPNGLNWRPLDESRSTWVSQDSPYGLAVALVSPR